MSGEVSYDVYVKTGVDHMGRDEFGEAVAHFVEHDNAVAHKRRLVARGETVRVERSVVHDLSEDEKERRFSDYSRVPEYELSREPALSQENLQEPLDGTESVGEALGEGTQSAAGGAQEGAGRPWWRRWFGG